VTLLPMSPLPLVTRTLRWRGCRGPGLEEVSSSLCPGSLDVKGQGNPESPGDHPRLDGDGEFVRTLRFIDVDAGPGNSRRALLNWLGGGP
jgi:hypothetical protein